MYGKSFPCWHLYYYNNSLHKRKSLGILCTYSIFLENILKVMHESRSISNVQYFIHTRHINSSTNLPEFSFSNTKAFISFCVKEKIKCSFHRPQYMFMHAYQKQVCIFHTVYALKAKIYLTNCMIITTPYKYRAQKTGKYFSH